MFTIPLGNLPLIKKGDNLGKIISTALKSKQIYLTSGDIVVVTEKIVSKAEGRVINLKTILPTNMAYELSGITGKDPRLVELILRESQEILRAGNNFIISVTNQGLICANAGIDQSNVKPHHVKLLPINSDKSAFNIKCILEKKFQVDLGVIIIDSVGRPFRHGSVGLALGCSGITPLLDLRGEKDIYRKELLVTQVAIADCLASTANIIMGEADEKIPVVIIRGLNYKGEGQASDLLRSKTEDLFR